MTPMGRHDTEGHLLQLYIDGPADADAMLGCSYVDAAAVVWESPLVAAVWHFFYRRCSDG